MTESTSVSANENRTRPCPLCDGAPRATFAEVVQSYIGHTYQLKVMICSGCGFHYAPDPPAVEYDNEYLEGDGIRVSADPRAVVAARARVRAIGARLPASVERSVLDVGVGDGLFLSVAEEHGFRTAGFDVNRYGLDVARREHALRADLRAGDLDSAFGTSRFGAINLNEVIEHLPDPVATLRWIRDHLAPGGIAAIQTGNVRCLGAWIKRERWDYLKPAHVSYFDESTMRRALSKAGLRFLGFRTIEWNLAEAGGAAVSLARSGRAAAGLHFLNVTVTGQIPNVRRSFVTYASTQ